MDDSVRRSVHQGDLISLHVDSIGYFGTPSQKEPIPERSDVTSHLRAITTGNDDVPFPQDFNSRCTFVITGEKGSSRPLTAITYGSFIRLKHKSTNCTLIASHQEDDFDEENCYNSVYLRSYLSPMEEMASTWQVLTRYRLRNEGDAVESDDFIVLRNSLFKNKYLTSIAPPATTISMSPSKLNHLVGLRRDESFFKLGWKIRVMLPFNNAKNMAKNKAHEEGDDGPGKVLLSRAIDIEGGMFVRMTHLESNGHFIARYDDSHVLTASMAPLGQFCQQTLDDPSHNVGIFVRGHSVENDPNSALSIWQILPAQLHKLGRFFNGDSIRFRHVLTGQYLCIRQVNEEKDSVSIRTRSVMKAVGNNPNKPQPTLRRTRSNADMSKYGGDDLLNTDYTVATTPEPDYSTLFHILTSDSITDTKEDFAVAGSSAITNQSDVFFLHEDTHFILEEKKRKTSSSNNQKKNDGSSKDKAKWEDYNDDIHIRPSRFNDSNVAVLREVYNLEPVPDVEVADVLYISKFLPIIKSAIVTLQHTKKMSVLYLPLFRHLNVATHTLISWVMNQNDSDNSLLLHPALTFDPSQHIEDKDIDDHIQEEEELNALERSFDQNYDVDNIRFEYQSVSEHSDRHDEDIFDDDESFNNKSVYSSFCDSTKYSISSLGPWIGRGMSPFKKSAIVNPIHSSRNPTFADFNPKRQNIVSDSRILDLLVLFTTLVFRLLKDQVLYLEKRENQALQSKHTADELKAMYHVPSLLTGTCILVHDLVHSVVYENRRNSVRILSVKGSLLDMMDQEILGWNPPIGTLLIALQSMKRGTVQRGSNFDPTMVLDDQNIHNLIRKTYELYMTNNESAVNLIKLLTTLCSPGKIPNPIFQSLILKAIFATQTEEDFEHDPPDSTEIVNNLSHSLLFSTRKVNGAAWQVKFKTPYKMITRHTDEETMKRSIVEELRALIALINPVARDGRLNITEVREFLTTLGLGGHSLYEESNFLECSDFHLVMEWFWRKRSHYFPSSRTSLNEITYEKVKAMIDVEVVLARCAGIKVSRNCDRSLSEFDDELVSESETSDSEEETDDDAQSAIVAARNRANSLSNILKREATVERNMSTDSGDPGFAAPKSGAGGVFRRLFQRKQQQYQEQELQQQLQQQQQQPQGQLVLQPVSDISDTEVATSDNDSSAGQAKQSTPKRGFFSRLKKTQEAQPEPARQLSRRDILRKESKDKALSLSPYEEFCEFREYVLSKIPDFDVGSYHDLHDNEYDHGTKKIQDSKNNYGGIVKKGLSMFLLYSTEQTMNAMKKKIKNNKGRSLAWNGLFQVLGHSSFERDWFRQSMIMMAELCRGENLQAQTLVNQLFPAAMVLDMLSFGGENSDKLAVVTLLQNLYVVHDLVFPVAATSGVKRRGGKRGNGNGSGIICSLNEGDSSILFHDAGKVFNNLTRSAPSINDGQPSSKVLRKMLWRNLSNEVDEIDLNSRDNEVLAYHTCLLTLLRELICKGFFVESGEFEAEYKRMKEVSRSSNVKVVDKNEKKSFFSFFSDISAKSLSFDEKDIEKILVRKITEMVDNNRDDIDSVQSGLLKTLDNWKAVNKISEDEHANIRQKLIKNSNPVSVGSEHINIVKDYFTENFSNSIKILLVEEVISILDLIYDSHQLSSVKEILKLLNNSDNFFIPDVLHGDALVSDHPIKFTGVQSTIKRLFISSREHEAMYTNAMLALTLFNSDKVKCCAYDLLYKNVSKKMNANEIISNLQILVCPKKSATLRLFQQFQYVARKYAHQMIAETDSSQFEYKKFISFAMNATKSLCYHVFHEKSTVSLLNISRPGSIDFMSGKLDYIPLISNGLVSDDDGDGIEMLSNKGAAYNISMSTNNANASLLAVTAKFIRFFNTQVEDHASDVSRDLLTVYMKDINNLANSRSGTCGHWMSLSSDQQFFIDAMLDMCATICVQRPALVIELLVNISKVATSFVWYSPGASRVTELLCEYCDVSGMIDESDFMLRMEELFLETVRDQKPNADVIRLIHAVLASNRDNNFMKHCHSFVDKHLLSNGSMRQYILLDMPDPTPKDIETHFQILRMFATFANISSKSILLKMKACLTVDFCQQLLSSCCPLQIKMCVITFCVRIYNSKEIPMLSYIAVDLNNILESIELGDTSSSAGTTSANAGSGQSASTDFSPRRLDPIRNPLLQYLEAVANVIVDTAVTDFLVDRNDISIIKSSIDNVHRDKSFLAALKTKKVVVLSYIEKKIIDTFEKEGIDSKKLTQFFEVLLPFYNIVKSTNMSSFRDLLFAKSEVFESVYSMFITAFLMMCGLTKSKDAVTFTKETMEQTDTKLNPNLVVKSHLEAMILTISLRRIEYENSVCREHFLLLDGIDLYNHQVARLLYEDSTLALSHNKKYDIASFALSLDYSHELSSAFIQQTTFFQVLQKHLHTATHFLENGGKDLIQGTLVNETSTLKRTPDFDKWTMCGGLYFHSLGTYMQNFSKPTSVNFFLLHALCELLENKIDKIRTSNETTKRKIKLMGKEVARLQKFQDTFENLGICDLVLAVVGRSLDDSLDDPFVFEFVPLALKVGFSMLASGNDSVQHALIGSYKSDHSTGMVGSHKKHFMEALRRILRGVILKIDNFVKLTSSGGKRTSKDFTFPINMFKLLIKIFDFCGSLCSGHNDQSRNFLRDQDHVGEPVDIVFDIAKAVNSLLGMLVSQMRYITFDHFYELLAPPVWDYYPDIKRRFIKWHDPRVNFDFVCQIFATLSSGFNALTEISQGPCFKNQPSALVATPYCQDLLEYVGAMQLRAKKNKAGATSFFDSKSIVWDGRHPLSFNKTYKHELKKIGRFRDDPDYELIIRQINSLSENSKETKRFNARMKLLTSMAQQVEQNCLRFLLALLEATSPLVSETLMGQLNDGILLQNMENQYKLSFESKGKLKKFRSDVTVSYLTLISIMASAMRDDPTAMLDDFLLQWKQDNAAQGYNTEKLVASIEVTSMDGTVQRVYFAIPAFVTRYWVYPEVQKAKDKFLWAVSRESPEDKLSDFYDRSDGLIQVMRRQEALRHVLTPLVHGIFGGVNFLVEKIVILQYFKMQPIFLMLSCCFNLANMYWQYREQYPWIVTEEYGFFKEILEFDQRDQYVFYLYCVHFSLAVALFIRAFLNSPAADNYKVVNIFERKNIVDIVLNGVVKLTLTMMDSWWPICLMAFSAAGILVNPYFFAPILLDLINQIRLMSFLLEAITRNLGRIAYTLLLAIIFLYLFAVITIVSFEDQYALAGKSACKDLISCFKLQIDYGLVNPPEWVGDGYIDPWISADAESTSYGHIASIIAGSVFNFSYIILINLVLQAIISGLIIDTFSEMRAESEEIEVDIREKCFICSIDRDEFEQLDIPFVEHTKTEHNMWQYIWFMIYLESKDPLSYTGPEQYLAENLTDKNGFVRLGPIRKSLSIKLKAGKAKEKISLKTVMDSIRETNIIQSAIRAKVDKTDKLAKDTNKAITSQKAKILEIEKLLTSSSETAMATGDHVADFKDDVNKKLVVILNTLGKKAHPSDHAHHHAAGTEHATTRPSDVSRNSQSTMSERPNPFVDNDDDSSTDDNASVVSGVGDL